MKKIFNVDGSLCVHCGTCSEVCPVKIIVLAPGKTPEPVAWARKVCINCGHCVAVCPKGALSLVTMHADDCAPIRKDLNVSWDEVDQMMRSRRSTRNYLNKPVDKGTIEKIIHTARYAPTGHNNQNVNWLVIYQDAKLRQLKDLIIEWMRKATSEDAPIAKTLGMKGILMGIDAGYDLIFRGAPHVIVTHAVDSVIMASSSCIIAVSYMELVARAAGLTTCWAGFLDLAAAFYPPVKEALELPEGHTSYASMMIGYPKHQYFRIPTRKEPPIFWK